MDKTKVTFRIFSGVDVRFKQELSRIFMKRDVFVGNILSYELPHISKALKGLKNSDEARSYITQCLKAEPLNTVTIVLSKGIADELNRVCETHNVVRDALINRILIVVSLTDTQLRKIGVEPDAVQLANMASIADTISSSPIGAIEYFLNDPLYLIRESLSLLDESIYTLDLDNLKSGLNDMTACYLPDECLPDPKFDELAASITVDDFLPGGDS